MTKMTKRFLAFSFANMTIKITRPLVWLPGTLNSFGVLQRSPDRSKW